MNFGRIKTYVKDHKYSLLNYLTLFLIGGIAYVGIETLYRGHSHWSMFILGGLCFLACGQVNEYHFSWNMSIWRQMLWCACIITTLEFFCGLLVNKALGWDVWDYSNMPFNVMGQICLPFSIIWYFLSLVAILLDDWIRWKFMGGAKPHYNWNLE